MIEFSIPGIPASKKTSQRIIRNKGTGKPMVIPSKRTLDWTATAKIFLRRAMKGQPLIVGPVQVHYIFYRSDGKADLGGMEAALDDALQGVIITNDKQIVMRQSSKCRLAGTDRVDGAVREL